MRKITQAMLEEFLDWLVRQRNGSFEIMRPLDRADDAGYGSDYARSCLWALEKSGHVRLSLAGKEILIAKLIGPLALAAQEDPEILSVEPEDSPPEKAVVVEAISDQAESAGKTVGRIVVVIDLDNLLIGRQGADGSELDAEKICRSIRNYARSLGKLARIEAHLTTKTSGFNRIIHFCYELEIAAVVVPPNPEAADEEIRATLEFGLLCPDVKCFILASNDSGFRETCWKIKNAGRRLHVITSNDSFGGLVAASTKHLSVESLLQEAGTAFRTEDRRQPNVRNRFTLSAVKLKEGREASTPAEYFVSGCYTAASTSLADGAAMSFARLADSVWSQLVGNWRVRGHSLRDCRQALTALVAAEMIKWELRPQGDHEERFYFME